jgi:hypothetical protein
MGDESSFIAWAGFRDREDNRIFSPLCVRSTHPELAYRVACRNASEMVWEGEFVGIFELEESEFEEEPSEAMLRRPSLPNDVPLKENLAAFKDRSWIRSEPTAAEIDEALAEPPSLFAVPGLYDVEWDSLTHTYGPATDIPVLLKGLAATDPSWRSRSLNILLSLLDHQSESGKVMAACIPLLLWFLETWPLEIEDRELLAEALAAEADSANVGVETIRKKWSCRSDLLPSLPAGELVEKEIGNRAAVARAFVESENLVRILEDDENPIVADSMGEIRRVIDSGFELLRDAS